MALCYECETGCCCTTVRATVQIALWHYILYGLFVTCFVFTNVTYPPLGLPDYLFGGSGSALLFFSFCSVFLVDARKCQCLRGFFAFVLFILVPFVVSCTFYYTIVRWNDIMVTLFAHEIRKAQDVDMRDYFWYTLVIISCVSCPIFLFYLFYILSFMCNPWKSHLFTSGYRNDMYTTPIPAPLVMPADRFSSQNTYKPYPVQGNN